MGRWLDGKTICNSEAPGIVQIRSGSIEGAGKVIGRAFTILDGEFVITAKKSLFLGTMDQPDRETTGGLDVERTTIRVKDISYFTALGVGVIEPEAELSPER